MRRGLRGTGSRRGTVVFSRQSSTMPLPLKIGMFGGGTVGGGKFLEDM